MKTSSNTCSGFLLTGALRSTIATPVQRCPRSICLLLGFNALLLSFLAAPGVADEPFAGSYFSGRGDNDYLRLLDTSRRMLAVDPQYQNMAMLYFPQWNGFVEGPTWDAWWIQNSYGTTYCALPIYDEPMITFLQNAQDLWFSQMGDGKTPRPFRDLGWVPPDGALCDAARPGWFVAKQGDGRVDIHDWGMEFTAAGLLMQAELLLISRDAKAIDSYLPKLERCANFIETRRDPQKNLFLAGPAGNLLAPSYAGYKKPDGTYGMAYLTGLSVTYIAALDRLIELEKLTDHAEKVSLYSDRRESARQGLATMMTEQGYLIRSLDPDGVKHGVYGADKHGYLETSPNHDAICFRVVDDAAARRIYQQIAAIPQLRPHRMIIPNYPSYDDMYEEPQGLWGFGTWVNGGHWSTCEARMIMGYARLGEYEDIRASVKQMMSYADRFRMDNPLTQFGGEVYQPNEPINLTYDAFGPMAAMIRGLFEYRYLADKLILTPRVPTGITELHQHFPIRFGKKRLYISVYGNGPVSKAMMNGQTWSLLADGEVTLPYDRTPDEAHLVIALGQAKLPSPLPVLKRAPHLPAPQGPPPEDLKTLVERSKKMRSFTEALAAAGLGQGYEAAHARLAADSVTALLLRREMQAAGKIKPLPEATQKAADRSYIDAATRLCDGLESTLAGYADSSDTSRQTISRLWRGQ